MSEKSDMNAEVKSPFEAITDSFPIIQAQEDTLRALAVLAKEYSEGHLSQERFAKRVVELLTMYASYSLAQFLNKDKP